MKRYDEFLINKLLDSYENSALYTESNKNNQRIYFNFNKKSIPDYFDEESIIYETINQMALDLKCKGFVDILWKNKREGHIIEKLALNTEKIEEAYKFTRRKQKKSLEGKVLELLESYASKDKTLDAFIDFLIERIKENKSVKKYFELEDLKYLEKLLKAILAVVSNSEEVYVRELSMKLFMDSKIFETMEGKVRNIILEFHPNRDYLSESEDIFGEFNVFKNPSYVMLKGVGTVGFKNSSINLKDIDNGIGISSKDLDTLEFVNCEEVKKLITIENLTAFNRFKDKEAIIIYLGGYHNESRRQLLKKLYKVYPHNEYYHWGDIDCGGFRIFKHLKERTSIPFKPMNMDIEILRKYRKYARELTQNDVNALAAMREDESFGVFHEVIKDMLQGGIKLEQEIVAYNE